VERGERRTSGNRIVSSRSRRKNPVNSSRNKGEAIGKRAQKKIQGKNPVKIGVRDANLGRWGPSTRRQRKKYAAEVKGTKKRFRR